MGDHPSRRLDSPGGRAEWPATETPPAAGAPVVCAGAADLYQWVLQCGFVDMADCAAVAEALHSPADVLAAHFETLLGLRLLRRAPHQGSVVVPASPEVAIAELVGPIELEIRQRQRSVQTLKAELSPLQGLYYDSRRARNSREAIDVIEEVDRIRATLADIARRCTVEVFSAHPGILSEAAIAESVPHDTELMARGVRMRSVYQHSARVHPRMREFLHTLTEAGAEVRTCEEIADRIIILDREVAVLSSRAAGGGAVVVREPSVVDYLYRGLEQCWSASLPLIDGSAPTAGYGVAGDDLKRAILRMLATGAKDDHIARRLGISVRTCRRHIAELMEELRATSRFQAGVLASSTGLLTDQTIAGAFAASGLDADDAA